MAHTEHTPAATSQPESAFRRRLRQFASPIRVTTFAAGLAVQSDYNHKEVHNWKDNPETTLLGTYLVSGLILNQIRNVEVSRLSPDKRQLWRRMGRVVDAIANSLSPAALGFFVYEYAKALREAGVWPDPANAQAVAVGAAVVAGNEAINWGKRWNKKRRQRLAAEALDADHLPFDDDEEDDEDDASGPTATSTPPVTPPVTPTTTPITVVTPPATATSPDTVPVHVPPPVVDAEWTEEDDEDDFFGDDFEEVEEMTDEKIDDFLAEFEEDEDLFEPIEFDEDYSDDFEEEETFPDVTFEDDDDAQTEEVDLFDGYGDFQPPRENSAFSLPHKMYDNLGRFVSSAEQQKALVGNGVVRESENIIKKRNEGKTNFFERAQRIRTSLAKPHRNKHV